MKHYLYVELGGWRRPKGGCGELLNPCPSPQFGSSNWVASPRYRPSDTENAQPVPRARQKERQCLPTSSWYAFKKKQEQGEI